MTAEALSVPTDAVLTVTRQQRNQALDENAWLWAHIEQLTAERDQLAAEVKQLRSPGA
jgi:cell division protein FtsB